MTQKIDYIHIKNFKGIKDIEVSNLGRFVAVFGHNGAGKTSFIDAIKAAIKAGPGTNNKVRIGEENGEIEIRFQDFNIKRIVGNKGTLKVEHNGKLVPTPQTRLDEIFQGTIGDPNKFLSLHSKEKVRYMLETQGKKEEYNELEDKRLPLFEKRKETHRTYLAKKEEVDKTDITEFSEINKQFDELEEQQLKQQMEGIEENNKKFYELETRLSRGNDVIENIKSSMSNGVKRIEELKKMIEDEEKKYNENSDQLDKAMQLRSNIEEEIKSFKKQDASEIMDKLNALNEKRKTFADVNARKELYKSQCDKRDELQGVWKDLDAQVRKIEGQQNALLKGINIGYEMKLEEGIMSVLIDKSRIPLDELNKALQIEIGIEICLNGPNKIKVITIEDANTLDPNTLERIKNKIEKIGAQCFIETVYTTGYDEIIIEDGVIK